MPLKKSTVIPLVLAIAVVIIWLFVPAAPVCKVLTVDIKDCTSWAAGLFGVALGGVVTLWASWHFGDKAGTEIVNGVVTDVDKRVTTRLETVSQELIKKMEEQLLEAAKRLNKSLPQQTLNALEANAILTGLTAAGPLISKLLPALIEQLKSPPPTPPPSGAAQEPTPPIPPADSPS